MIESYLDQLLLRLRWRAVDVRRILAEVEDHLREATADGVASGLPSDEAERRAIERFGSPSVVARRFSTNGPWLTWPALRELVRTLVLLAGIGLVAVGISGVVALGLRVTLGADYVAADPPGVTYTPARCTDFLEYHPRAGSCEAAAAAHHADEVTDYRVAAGLLGGILLIGWWVLARRNRRSDRDMGWLPGEFVPIVGMSLFGVAAAALSVQTLAASVGAGAGGAGEWLSGAVVSAAAAALFGAVLLQHLRVRAPMAAA